VLDPRKQNAPSNQSDKADGTFQSFSLTTVRTPKFVRTDDDVLRGYHISTRDHGNDYVRYVLCRADPPEPVQRLES